VSFINETITLSWTTNSNICIPISSYNIYQNGKLIQNQPYTITDTIIYGLSNNMNYSFYISSISNMIESSPSNILNLSL
jgi:hypothetical protein